MISTPRTLLTLAALAALAACDRGPQTVATPSPETATQGTVDPVQATTAAGTPSRNAKVDAPLPTDAWIGKWTGVEGLALEIGRGATPGKYVLKVTLMDSTNSYDGTVDAGRIRFERAGKIEYVRHVLGAETGLKWLATKADCLMIAPGEGFCRG